MPYSPDLDHTLVAAFLEHIPFYVYFKDRQSRFIACSVAHARRHGLTPAQMIGKSDTDLFADEHASESLADERRIMATGEPIIRKLERETLLDGTRLWSSTTKLPLRDQSGTIIGTFGISKDVTDDRRAEDELEKIRKELLQASHQAGMAEVATGVLHNVGNVLNSVNVSIALIEDGLRDSKLPNLAKAGELLSEHADRLTGFLTEDPRGRQLPAYLHALTDHLLAEREQLMTEVRSLRTYVEHMKDIVAMQQSYATQGGRLETVAPAQLVDDALRLNNAALARHDVKLSRDVAPVPDITVEKVRVLQILVNLIRNAKYAMDEAAPPEKRLRVGVAPDGPGHVVITIADNGVGIASDRLEKIFTQGYTTRADGHGFGLHSSALAARDLGGRLDATSEGRLQGSVFSLRLPVAPPDRGPSDEKQGSQASA